MGINCCSNAKEPTEITITKPEKNMSSTSQNPISQNNQIKVQNITEQIQDLKQSMENSNSNIIIPNEMNTLNSNSDVNQNNISPLSQKEIDDILNKVNYDNQPQVQQKEIINIEKNNINNNIINNVTPNVQNIQQIQKNEKIITQNNNSGIDQLLKPQNQNDANNQNIPKQEQKEIIQPNVNQNIPKENININNINIQNIQNDQMKTNIPQQDKNVYIQPIQNITPNIQSQTQKIIAQNIQKTQNITRQNPNVSNVNIQNFQNIPVQNQNKEVYIEQNIPNTQIIQNTQNITNDLNPLTKTKIEEEIEKYFSSQQNQVINDTPNLNIEEILNNQNNKNQNENITDNNKYIEDLLKNNSSNQNVSSNNNINFDALFTQGEDIKIDDALIDKLFESAGKPVAQSQVQKQNINVNNQVPLYLSQNFNPTQNLGNLNNNNYFSPLNSTQRSEISEPGSLNYKQFYSIK